MSVTREGIATVVRGAMAEVKISQRELADQTGIPLPTLARRLSGRTRSFTVPELIAVGRAVDVELGELVERFVNQG